jgi:hypothetical protein
MKPSDYIIIRLGLVAGELEPDFAFPTLLLYLTPRGSFVVQIFFRFFYFQSLLSQERKPEYLISG